jgi:hypothetical protein
LSFLKIIKPNEHPAVLVGQADKDATLRFG